MGILQGISDYIQLRRNFRSLRAEQLHAYHRNACQEILSFAIKHSSFYHAHYAGCDLNHFQTLPTINKASLMEHFDTLTTTGLRRTEVESFALEMEHSGQHLGYMRGPDGQEYVIGMSSGTSGSRGLYITERSVTERLPFVFAARSGLPLSLLPWRIVFMLRVFSQAFQNINAPFIHLDYVNTMTAVQQVRSKVRTMSANVLMAPPSMLRILADYAPEMPSLRRLITYAEVLEEDDERVIREAFQIPLSQIYQASEGVIACPCSHGTLHINEDLVYVELLDDDNQPVTIPGSRVRKMLLTNLYNRAQPLIRYELNDLIELGEPCACGSGFRSIHRVLGRADDVLWFSSVSGKRQYLFPDLISRWIITAHDAIREYRVEQASDDSLAIQISAAHSDLLPDIEGAVRAALFAGLKEHACIVPRIDFVGPVLALPAGAKRKRFVRHT